MVFQMILLVLFCTINIAVLPQAAAAAGLVNSTCPAMCGDVCIPYPFGIIESGGTGRGNHRPINDWFAIVCDNTSADNPKPYLNRTNLEVLHISVNGTVRVNIPNTTWACPSFGGEYEQSSTPYDMLQGSGSPFVFSKDKNRFIAMGCNNFGAMTSSSDGSIVRGCMSVCDEKAKSSEATSCDGINCCQTTIPSDLKVFDATIMPLDSINPHNSRMGSGCKYAFLVEKKWLATDLPSFDQAQNTLSAPVPVVLEWALSNSDLTNSTANNDSTYSCVLGSSKTTPSITNTTSIAYCSCNHGYQGNPYVPQGCQDIDECALSNPCRLKFQGGPILNCENTMGSYHCYNPLENTKSQTKLIFIGVGTSLGLLFLLIGTAWWSYKMIKKRKKIKRKQKFFKQNGGLLLQQQLSSGQINIENINMFNSKELEKATDHFNVNRILGQGGQGTVYKGMLIDGRIVAVKKSKIIDEGKLEQFINEVVILSQINHRNVVKLLGCCLETEVPLLVYEFISNGTLSQYINDQNEEFPLTWDVRLRIATEIAGALFYLHSAAASPIYHRDIKSTNILLDDKYRAKVADFGTSRTIAIDQTHLTTQVHGTFGYLDPEYFQSSQFTEKSDVYSFGVVLVELLTGQKAISSTRTSEGKSLATYFILSMKDNRLFDILDPRVLKEGEKEQIIRFGNLAKRCLNLNGKKRPAMKEVAIELEAIQILQKAPTARQNYEVFEYAKTDIYEAWDVASTSTMSGLDSSKISSLDTQPFLSS